MTTAHRPAAGGRTPPELRRARLATATLSFANGCGLGSWLPHIPDVKIWHGLTDGVLGLALLAIAGGAVAALPVAGALTARYGAGPPRERQRSCSAPCCPCRCSPRTSAAARGLRPARHRHRRARRLDECPCGPGRGALWPVDHVVVPRPVQPRGLVGAALAGGAMQVALPPAPHLVISAACSVPPSSRPGRCSCPRHQRQPAARCSSCRADGCRAGRGRDDRIHG